MQTVKTRTRHGEIRVAVAHLLRLLLDGMQPGLLRTDAGLRPAVVGCIDDTRRHLAASPQGAPAAAKLHGLATFHHHVPIALERPASSICPPQTSFIG